jgi:magnesium transporter
MSVRRELPEAEHPVHGDERSAVGEPAAAGMPGQATEEPHQAGPTPARGFRAWAWRDETLVMLDDPTGLSVAAADPSVLLWVDLQHDDAPLVGATGEALGLHPLVIEDIVEQNQRAKVEQTDGMLHLVMFALTYGDERLRGVEIDFVLGERFLLTAHGPGWDPLEGHHLRSGVAPYLREGPDYLLWALADTLVDGYFPVFDRLGDDLDDLEDQVIRRSARDIVERLFDIKRALVTIRHTIAPQREIFNQLTNREMGLVRPERIVYFRDVYDHLIRLADELDTYRDMVGTALDAYLTTVNNDLSEVMKRLTAVTVVLAGVAAIGGLFGMSEAGPAFAGAEQTGFWIVVVAAAALGAVAVVFFRRIGWL